MTTATKIDPARFENLIKEDTADSRFRLRRESDLGPNTDWTQLDHEWAVRTYRGHRIYVLQVEVLGDTYWSVSSGCNPVGPEAPTQEEAQELAEAWVDAWWSYVDAKGLRPSR